MTRILIGLLSLALVGVGGLVAAVDGFGEDLPARSVSIPAGTTTDDQRGHDRRDDDVGNDDERKDDRRDDDGGHLRSM